MQAPPFPCARSHRLPNRIDLWDRRRHWTSASIGEWADDCRSENRCSFCFSFPPNIFLHLSLPPGRGGLCPTFIWRIWGGGFPLPPPRTFYRLGHRGEEEVPKPHPLKGGHQTPPSPPPVGPPMTLDKFIDLTAGEGANDLGRQLFFLYTPPPLSCPRSDEA